MGYDMEWVATPADVEAAYSAARDQFRAACHARDEGAGTQAVVDETYDAMGRAHRSYFRLNIWGMGVYVRAMAGLGMLCESDPGPWPEKPDGLDWDLIAKVEEGDLPLDPADPGLVGAASRYHLAVEEHLVTGSDSFGIPVHKLYTSNDGWLVTPGELIEALSAWDGKSEYERDQALEEAGINDRDYWARWIEFMRAAIDHGGFRVR